MNLENVVDRVFTFGFEAMVLWFIYFASKTSSSERLSTPWKCYLYALIGSAVLGLISGGDSFESQNKSAERRSMERELTVFTLTIAASMAGVFSGIEIKNAKLKSEKYLNEIWQQASSAKSLGKYLEAYKIYWKYAITEERLDPYYKSSAIQDMLKDCEDKF